MYPAFYLDNSFFFLSKVLFDTQLIFVSRTTLGLFYRILISRKLNFVLHFDFFIQILDGSNSCFRSVPKSLLCAGAFCPNRERDSNESLEISQQQVLILCVKSGHFDCSLQTQTYNFSKPDADWNFTCLISSNRSRNRATFMTTCSLFDISFLHFSRWTFLSQS